MASLSLAQTTNLRWSKPQTSNTQSGTLRQLRHVLPRFGFFFGGVNGFGGVFSAVVTPRMKRSSAPGSSSTSIFTFGFLDMPDPSDKHKVFESIRDLSHDRELAASIGDMIIAWAQAEQALSDIMHRITGMSYAMVLDVMTRITTFESKIKTVALLITRWCEASDDSKAVLEAVQKLSKLSATRNAIVHASYAVTFDKKLTVAFDFREPEASAHRRRVIKAHDVKAHVSLVQDRTWKLIQLVSALQPKPQK
jgi:hypothetical protein